MMMVAVLLVIMLLAIFMPMLTMNDIPVSKSDCHHHKRAKFLPQQASDVSDVTLSNFQRDLTVMCEKNENLVDIYNELGQSIAALNIQLQVAQKLWQTNPNQAKESVSEAYHLSGVIMREVRETVRSLSADHRLSVGSRD